MPSSSMCLSRADTYSCRNEAAWCSIATPAGVSSTSVARRSDGSGNRRTSRSFRKGRYGKSSVLFVRKKAHSRR